MYFDPMPDGLDEIIYMYKQDQGRRYGDVWIENKFNKKWPVFNI